MIDYEHKKQLGILVKIAMVDEEFAQAEKDTIKKIGKKYGATDEELADIMNAPPINESLAPMTITDKMDFMIDCMLVILADDVVTSSEQYFARQIAGKLGFKVEVIDFLIEHKDEKRDNLKEMLLSYFN